MAIRPGEVEREELLRELAPYQVTNAQLLRWVQAGLLPRPRREGLGRGRGGRSYYPGITVKQAGALAELLKRDRNLAEAGWRLWLIGYPVTLFARALLLEELTAQEAALRDELARLRKGRRSRFAVGVRRERGDPALARVRAMLNEGGLQTMGRMVAEQLLGILRTEKYTDEEWDNYGDATVAMVFPDLLDRPGLADSTTFKSGIQKLTHDANLKQRRAMLKRTDDKLLVTARNEVQWLWEYFRDPVAPEFPFPNRGDFLWFLGVRLQPDGPKAIALVMQALGQEHVPLSPLERRRRAQQPQPAPASPPATGT
jgi:hypothetical protein